MNTIDFDSELTRLTKKYEAKGATFTQAHQKANAKLAAALRAEQAETVALGTRTRNRGLRLPWVTAPAAPAPPPVSAPRASVPPPPNPDELVPQFLQENLTSGRYPNHQQALEAACMKADEKMRDHFARLAPAR